ncbi:4-hydroxythreonine-4-phosphate dehydrogenase PdxA [Cognatishimia sp. MH4019]|uniref:4-hydroxythreonine-4-phosphate dehydrogenase PdxA n=1 Tax=Cognatishimia sp. MH4019 TaxID=2854030 RepID=UPI001CD68629|nr:4-hydroxythreonine-4-phosphate dehydrogenase PdxA [Cognatishimia sp. MH4019]
MSPALPIALSCGEPAGIGPEIAMKAWAALKDSVPFFYIGDPAHLDGPVSVISDPSEAISVAAGSLSVLPLPFEGTRSPGLPQPAQAQSVIDAIARGVELVQAGQASALTTCPIHKKALQDGAGFAYPGHTEYLASLGGVGSVVMMLACDELRVVPATIHIPLKDVPAHLSAANLTDTILITHAALRRDFCIDAPKIAVAGLNPHAGEGGAMGLEEIELIAPTLDALRAEGLDLIGPLSADTMFHARARAGYDAAIAMYHDQALIPIKTIDFDRGVNVTLGLPFIRTSPDHGTAFDIAGKDVADPTSLIEALKMAQRMAEARA